MLDTCYVNEKIEKMKKAIESFDTANEIAKATHGQFVGEDTDIPTTEQDQIRIYEEFLGLQLLFNSLEIHINISVPKEIRERY